MSTEREVLEDGILATAGVEVSQLLLMAGSVLGALILIVGVWTAVSSVSGAVVAPGFLRVEAHVQQVQHHEGGIVRRLLVKEGERVSQGQALMELENVEADSATASLLMQVDAELGRIARLQAEQAGSAHVVFPPELTDRKHDAAVAKTLTTERQHFQARRQMYAEQYAKLGDQRQALLAEISSLGRQIEAADKSLGFLKEQEQMAVTLYEQKFYSQTRVLDSKRAHAEKEEKKYEFESLRAQARQKLADVEMRRDSLQASVRSDAARDIADAQVRVAELREKLRPVRDALERRKVRSPSTGILNVLKVYNPGAVISPRDVVAEVVPDTSELLGEVRVSPGDASELYQGQMVDLELSGLNRRVTPLLSAKVSFVSPDLNTDPVAPNNKFFVARIRIENPAQAAVTLSPGMPVVAYIKTQERSPLQLWLDPVIGALRHSLRER